MDIHWGNKVLKLVTGTLLVLMLLGCKSRKIVSENIVSESKETFNRVELVVKQNPFKITTQQTVVFDSIGRITPIKLLINKNGVTGEVTLDNNELVYVLESKDTLVLSRDVKEIKSKDTSKDTSVVLKKTKTFFERIKQYFSTIIWTAVVLVLIYLVFRVVRKVYYPL